MTRGTSFWMAFHSFFCFVHGIAFVLSQTVQACVSASFSRQKQRFCNAVISTLMTIGVVFLVHMFCFFLSVFFFSSDLRWFFFLTRFCFFRRHHWQFFGSRCKWHFEKRKNRVLFFSACFSYYSYYFESRCKWQFWEEKKFDFLAGRRRTDGHEACFSLDQHEP